MDRALQGASGSEYYVMTFFAHYCSRASTESNIFELDSDFYNFQYRNLLSTFFEDKKRSGKYHVDGTVYARAALECFRNMFNPNDG